MQCSPIMEAHYAMLVLGTQRTQCWGPSGPSVGDPADLPVGSSHLSPSLDSDPLLPQSNALHSAAWYMYVFCTEVSVQHSFVLVVYSGVIEKAFLSFIRAARIE